MMQVASKRLALLQRKYPEWRAWLAVVEAVMQESVTSNWQAGIPRHPIEQNLDQPLLTAATIAVDESDIASWLEHLLDLASRANNDALANLIRLNKGAVRGCSSALLRASVDGNYRQINEFARALDVDSEGFRAVVELTPLPLMQACRRCWSTLIRENWSAGYCPVCGAWPAFAEEQGIERIRVLRCARCGAGWRSECLRCPYCATTEHAKLTSLVLGAAHDTWRIDACTVCLGYVKTMLVLQGCAPEEILLEDLATVELDIAAGDAGYVRPANPGYAPAIRLAALTGQNNDQWAGAL